MNGGKSHYLLVVSITFPLLLAGGACQQRKPPRQPCPELKQVAQDYAIEIVAAEQKFQVRVSDGTIRGMKVDRKDISDFSALFAAEFSLYPPDLVRRTKLKRIILCADLSFAGEELAGLADSEHDELYLDIGYASEDEPYLRETIHHEFFHIIDYQYDGSGDDDNRWASLNSANFKYGNGGKSALHLPDTCDLSTEFPGFLNHYSTTAVEEDKAEVFANLIVNFAYVEARCKKDRVLRAKVRRMKDLLARFCPAINDQFWEKVKAVKRTEQEPLPE